MSTFDRSLSPLPDLKMFFFKKKESPKKGFMFLESETTACLVCDHVLNQGRPILYVTHEPKDGFWQFLCGQSNYADANIKIISLKQVTELDATVNDLFEMPLGVGANRKSINDKWEPFNLSR